MCQLNHKGCAYEISVNDIFLKSCTKKDFIAEFLLKLIDPNIRTKYIKEINAHYDKRAFVYLHDEIYKMRINIQDLEDYVNKKKAEKYDKYISSNRFAQTWLIVNIELETGFDIETIFDQTTIATPFDRFFVVQLQNVLELATKK